MPILLQNSRQYLDGNIWSIFSVHHPNIDQILPSVVVVTRAHYMRVIKNICAASWSTSVYRCTKKLHSMREHSIIKGILKSEQKPLAYHLVWDKVLIGCPPLPNYWLWGAAHQQISPPWLCQLSPGHFDNGTRYKYSWQQFPWRRVSDGLYYCKVCEGMFSKNTPNCQWK